MPNPDENPRIVETFSRLAHLQNYGWQILTLHPLDREALKGVYGKNSFKRDSDNRVAP